MSFVLIFRCENFPTFEILNVSFNIDDSPSTILCEIASNFYFFTIFLRELKLSERFLKLFCDYFKRIRCLREKPCRTSLPPIFSSIDFYRTRIRFQVDSKVNLFDESINRRWASIQLRVLTRRIHYESSWAWLSTLGGGHSCLGEVLKKHALEAEQISKNQIRLSNEIGDPNAIIKSYLFLALSYLQQKRFDEARAILRYQYRCVHQKDVTDDRLKVMCIALWKKMKYAIETGKNHRQN